MMFLTMVISDQRHDVRDEVRFMLPVVIETLVVGTPPAPSVIVLRPINDKNEDHGGRLLPIWIGPTEAASIGMALQGASHKRPMTHDLFGSLLSQTDAKLDHIVIDHVEGTTFYSSLVLEQNNVLKNIDARPSDSIALALHERVPMYVEEEVLDLASVPASLMPTHSKDIEVKEFHDFIESVNPEDFKEA